MSRTTPQKASVMPPSARSVLGSDGRVFVKNTVVNIGSFHIAPTKPIALIMKKIKHKHIQKESTFTLPLITSPRPLLGGLPLETIQPLATRADAWQAIPRVSDWVLGIIKRGYTLQFDRRPQRFGGVVSTSVQHSTAHVLHTKVMSLQVIILLLHPKEGWCSKTHPRSQTSELCPYETAIQDDCIEADPLANIIFAGSERHLLSHSDSSPPQVVLEIHL